MHSNAVCDVLCAVDGFVMCVPKRSPKKRATFFSIVFPFLTQLFNISNDISHVPDRPNVCVCTSVSVCVSAAEPLSALRALSSRNN